METQKTSNSWNNFEKEEQRWSYHAPWPQTILQSYSNQTTMVLSQWQIHRSIEQNTEPRNKPRLIWSIVLKQGKQWRKDNFFMGVPRWLSRLRIWCCHCYGMSSIPGPGISICHRWGGGVGSFFSKWYWENWTAAMQKNWIGLFSYIPYTNINSKWIKYLNVRPETIKLLEENIGSTLFDINLRNIFWICILRQANRKQK